MSSDPFVKATIVISPADKKREAWREKFLAECRAAEAYDNECRRIIKGDKP